MGDRITFRERTPGVCVSNGGTPMPAVSIVEPRVKFIEGWHTTEGTDPGDGSVECGEGTAYPMEVTVDQLAEIYYRVKDAKFTSGYFQIHYSLFGDDLTMQVSSVPPSTDLVEIIDNNSSSIVSARGYYAAINDASPEKPLADVGNDLFGVTYYYNTLTSDLAIRDIQDKESALWSRAGEIIDLNLYGTYWDGSIDLGVPTTGSHDPTGFRTAFNQTFINDGAAAIYGIYNDANGIETRSDASLVISSKVAFVDVTGSGDPLDSGNRLFISLSFLMESESLIYVSSDSQSVASLTSAGINLTIELSGGLSVSCPLYYDTSLLAPDWSFMSATDFIIEATEWWPYATSTGDPAWDEDTGLPINGGPSS